MGNKDVTRVVGVCGSLKPASKIFTAVAFFALLLTGCGAYTEYTNYPPWWPTPESRVADMLAIAELDENDIVYDLGSGDGRIVIAAAKEYGARGVGVEYAPALVKQSRRAAEEAGVSERVRFVQGDFYETDFSEATVVMLYLFEQTNEKLKPYLVEQLAPDAKIVTYKYKMPGWTPVKSLEKVYLYAIPVAEE